jgi:Anti-sigma factor NepR
VAEGKSSKSPPSPQPTSKSRDEASTTERDVGSALRAAYDSALNEDIPPEMLDLLSKLR